MQNELMIDELDSVTGGEIKCNRHTVAIELDKGTLTFTSFTCNGQLLSFGTTWTPTAPK
jgi:hypothetical protein